MDSKKELTRFMDAQNQMYLRALSEIRNGRKETQWMWYIFPELKGLDHSEKAAFYGIRDEEEAMAYVLHPVLGRHLIEISKALLQLEGKTATEVFGTPDDLKLWSCMTLFSSLKNADPVFEQVLVRYFNGLPDALTLLFLIKNQLSHETV